jgi:glucokinase
MKNEHCVACLDIGGTSVKSGVVRKDGPLYAGSLQMRPVDSGGTAETILASFADSLREVLDLVQKRDLILDGIGIAICGPFDYEKGISKIRGLDKYESLYDVNVKAYLQNALELPPNLPMLFDVDAWAFARGEVWVGAGKPYQRVIVFTMGTGVGSAFAVNGKIVGEGPGVPWIGWISGQKYRDGILNDYISRTYMMKRYKALTGRDLDIKEMADKAREGDRDASRVFEEIGSELGCFLREHHVKEFRAECIIFGGQISRSYELFVDPVKSALEGIESLQAILPAMDIECSALKGAAKFVFDSIAADPAHKV